MNLSRALGIQQGDSVAFVGAGGKTSAMFALARESSYPIILTTTTHMGVWQAAMADSHYVIRQKSDLDHLQNIGNGVILLTGPVTEDDRFSGLNGQMIAAVGDLCQKHNIVLLIEADGARQRFLKAPAYYEPVIPDFVDQVVVMAGLMGLDQPLNDAYIHRPEQFSKISGRHQGDRIGIEDLANVLRSEIGGLKGIPQGSRKVLFLNQADNAVLSAKGNRIVRSLIEVFDRILIGSIHQPGETGVIASVHAPTAGVVLAAGGSERFGEPKQLLNWAGEPFIARVVKSAIQAELSPILVVTGREHQKIEMALRNLPIHLIHNPAWREGQSTSMRLGLEALPDHIDSVMFLLSDQPQVSPLLIRQLVEARAAKRSVITAPMAGGRRGNPVLFGREAIESLMSVKGDQGGRAVFNKYQVEWLPWIDSRIQLDVDNPGDFEILRHAYFD